MRVRKSFLPGALLRSFSSSSTGQDVGIICRKPRKNSRDASLSCAYLKHSSIGTACASIVGVIQAKKKVPTWSRAHGESCAKKSWRRRIPGDDDVGGGAQQRIGPTRTGVRIERAAPRWEI